jgi:hypothetical protein
MAWIGLVYSLPGSDASSRRVALWRRLQKLGAVAPTGSLYLLPAGDDHLESFTWLAQEIRDGGGEAMVLRIERLEGDAEARAIAAFRTARAEDYTKLTAEAEAATESLKAGTAASDRGALRDTIEKLRRRLADLARIDFFAAPEGAQAQAALARQEALLTSGGENPPPVSRLDPARYRGKRWVTRPHPHVDRLACAWLIRRFLDPDAAIRYAETPRPREVPFDMPGVELGHQGNRCSFETMVAAFGLAADPALVALGEIVHAIDLQDGATRSETAGIAEVLRGWAEAGWSDRDLERNGIALFEGLYRALGEPGAHAARRSKRGSSSS